MQRFANIMLAWTLLAGSVGCAADPVETGKPKAKAAVQKQQINEAEQRSKLLEQPTTAKQPIADKPAPLENQLYAPSWHVPGRIIDRIPKRLTLLRPDMTARNVLGALGLDGSQLLGLGAASWNTRWTNYILDARHVLYLRTESSNAFIAAITGTKGTAPLDEKVLQVVLKRVKPNKPAMGMDRIASVDLSQPAKVEKAPATGTGAKQR